MNPQHLVDLVQSVIGNTSPEHPTLLHRPLIIGREKEYVQEVINSGHLSAGKWVRRFEEGLCAFLGAKYAIAVTNATCGLHAAITVMSGNDKKVYRIPSLTFVATANAVSYGGHDIRFVEHYGYGDITVDVLGHPHFFLGCPLRDAAQALGSKRYGEYVGAKGTCIFSFNQNKIITAGSGGAIVTDDDALAKEIRHLITTARVDHAYETAHNAVAWNYRMSDVTAALLVAQLEQLPLILKAKRELAKRYKIIFDGIKGVTFWNEPENSQSNFWMNAITIENEQQVAPCILALQAAGIMAGKLPTPIHLLPMYAHCECDPMEKTVDTWKRTIRLPSSPELGLKYV